MTYTSSAVTCINGICTNGMNCVHCGMPVEREERYNLSGFHTQRLCNECRSLAIDLYQHGESQNGIAREMGIARPAVHKLLIQEGLVDGERLRAMHNRVNRAYRERHHEDVLRGQREHSRTERGSADRREYMREYCNTEEYRAHHREYEREYQKTEKYKAYVQERRSTEEYKAHKREYRREYRKKQKELRSSQP